MKGTVVRTFLDKGYIFVKGDDNISRFVHASWVEWGMFDNIQVGMSVEFTPGDSAKGPVAKDVKEVK